MSILLPCPACESTDVDAKGYVYVQCNTCLCTGPQMNGGVNDEHTDYIDTQNAIRAWNAMPRSHKCRCTRTAG